MFLNEIGFDICKGQRKSSDKRRLQSLEVPKSIKREIMSSFEELLESLRSAAMKGKWSVVFEMCKEKRVLRTAKITATGDTVLHMVVSSGRVRLVALMVDLLVREEKTLAQNNVGVRDGEESWNVNSVLGAENDQRNTPLHLAAMMGNVEMCKKIGDIEPSLIAKRNDWGETPLFLAALHGGKEAFLWLHHLYMKSDGVSSTNFAHYIRDNDDTILHCAIAQGHIGVAAEIVHLYKDHMEEMMKRNKEGLSPLHLLAAQRSAFKTNGLFGVPLLLYPIYWFLEVEKKNRATTLEELEKKNQKSILVIRIIKLICLWLLCFPLQILLTPLFPFQAGIWFDQIRRKQMHTWSLQIMNELLQHVSDEDMSQIIVRTAPDQLSIPLQTEKDNESESGRITIETPLMIAAKNGVVEMVARILELFPSRIRDVNAEGKNILLLAVEYRQTVVFRFLCKQKWLTESLFGQVDDSGNNALHLAARLVVDPDWLSPGEVLPMVRDIMWFEFVKGQMPRGLLEQYNRKMETPDEIFKESHKELLKSERESVAKASQACSVVSTIVLSMAFATRTSVPGGYDEKGYAILRNNPPIFKTFVRSSFGALFCSLVSTIAFLSLSGVSYQAVPSWKSMPTRFLVGMYLLFVSIVCLWISFCAGDFFLLDDENRKLHKAIPRYILWASVVIFWVVVRLPAFLGSAFASSRSIPDPRRKATRPIQYRRIDQ